MSMQIGDSRFTTAKGSEETLIIRKMQLNIKPNVQEVQLQKPVTSPSLTFSMMPVMSEAGIEMHRRWLGLSCSSDIEICVAYGIIKFQDHKEQKEKEKVGKPGAFTEFLYKAGFSLETVKWFGGNYRYFLPAPDNCNYEKKINRQLKEGLGVNRDIEVFRMLKEKARNIEQGYRKTGQEQFYTI